MPVLHALRSHRTNKLNSRILVYAGGTRTTGGAPSTYFVLLPNPNAAMRASSDSSVQVGHMEQQEIFQVLNEPTEVVVDYLSQSAMVIKDDVGELHTLICIPFQNGSMEEVGVTGITNEIILSILSNRLECFQHGPFPSKENVLALQKVEEAKLWLHARQLDRESRMVDGKYVP